MANIKNILLSAYACEPNKGSEPGIGWNWAIELSRQGFNVSVITRKNNKEGIELELRNLKHFTNLNFYYYDLSGWMLWLKKRPFGIYFYYLFWQIGILKLAKKISKETKIDLVHHISFGVFRQPSFLWKLKKPFVFGPVGGAEKTPRNLLKSLPLKLYLKEVLRETVNFMYKFSPILNKMYSQTDIILCKTKDTLQFIPERFNKSKFLQIEIGIHNVKKIINQKEDTKVLKVLYVGRFIGLKGIHLSIDAVNIANANNKEVEFTLIGKGSLKNFLQKKVKDNNIKFKEWVTQEELFKYYSSYDCLLFPSFHDSSGNVIIESFSFGLPVICLNTGGPAVLVDETCGCLIEPKNKSSKEVSEEIASILLDLKKNPKKLLTLKKGALAKALTYTWTNTVSNTYRLIKENIE